MSLFYLLLLALALSLCTVASPALAEFSGPLVEVSDTSHSSHSHRTHERHGRVKRSKVAKDQFKKSHPCPSTGKSRGVCPGYVIDHVQPLKRGGRDEPENMQWQTVQEAKIKDRRE